MTHTDDQTPSAAIPITEEQISVQQSDQTEEINAWKQKYLRALADYQNLEKRTAQRLHDDVRMAAKQVIRKLLPVIDVLYKAQASLKDQGLALAIKQLEDTLYSEHVKKLDVMGKPFDPQTMECIEVVGEEANDTVIEETQTGYSLYDTVIRPAQVKVGKKKGKKD